MTELSKQQSPSTYSSSSRTISTKSTASSVREELDFTKENSKSPIDLEVSIHTERITKIFDEAIYKAKLAICLPALMRGKILNSHLSQQHNYELEIIYDEYNSDLLSPSLLNVEAMCYLRVGDYAIKNRLNPEQGHLMYILFEYPVLRPVVEEMVEQMREGYISYETKPPQPCLEFMISMERFRDLMIGQMQRSAADELTSKIQVKKIENNNSKLMGKIDEYKLKLKEESENFQNTYAAKSDLIAKLECELAFLKYASSEKLKKKILDSERQMVLQYRSHEVKQEMLKEEDVQTRERYNTYLKTHMADEKNLRNRRFKCETQLISWIQRYDVDMLEKQVELDHLTEAFDVEEKKVKELEEKLAEQDKEYLPLMAEKEEEYHKEMTEKMKTFMFEHAAKVIQTAWRQVLSARAEKRKLRKLIKKMHDEAEAAERRREKRQQKTPSPKEKKKK